MRVLFAAVLLAAGVCAAQAQTIDNAQIVAAGTFRLGTTKTITDPSISTGQRIEAPATLIQETSTMTLKKGIVIGFQVIINGKPKGQTVPIRVIWRYPSPGIRNPDTGIVKMTDDYIDHKTLGEKTTFYWNLSELYTLVPGEWDCELRDGDRLLAKQAFILNEP